MPDRFAQTHIQQHPLFQNLSPEQLNQVVQAFDARHYDPGDTIFQEGDPTRGLWLFTQGEAVFLRQNARGGYQRVGGVQAGQELNRAALFNEGRQTATLQATQPVDALLLSREKLARLLSHHPEIAQAMGLQVDAQHHMHDVHFRTQREDERVLHKSHRHAWAYLRWMWIPLLVMVSFWGIAYLAPSLTALWVLLSGLIPAALAIYIYLEWKNDTVIITDQRVKQITFNIPTLSEVRDEVAIESVQETNVVIPSLDIFAWILGYGHVEIKTAGSAGNFTLVFMPDPQHIQDLLMESYQQNQRANEAREQEVMRAEVKRWLQQQRSGQPVPDRENHQEKSPPGIDDGEPVYNVTADRIEKFGTHTSGPLSPFVTGFTTQGGATVYRKHWVVWMRQVIVPFLLMLASVGMFVLMLSVSALQALLPVGLAIPAVMFLIGAVWGYFADWDWRHDYYVMTDTNITIIHQRPFFLQSENDKILLKQVDNVVAESSGVFQQVLKYGDVRVALVGSDAPKHLHDIANPVEVQSEISRRQRRMEAHQEESSRRAQREAIGEYLSMYHNMSQQEQQALQNQNPPPQWQPRQQQQQQQHSAQQNQAPQQPRISPAAPRDRNRPPGLPQQRPPESGQQNPQNQPRPAMSSGRRYQPQQQQNQQQQNNNQWQNQQQQRSAQQQWQQRQPPLHPNQGNQGQNWQQNPPSQPNQSQQTRQSPNLPPPPPMNFPQANRPQTRPNDEGGSSARPPGVPRRRTDS
jgi:hypothetical protein